MSEQPAATIRRPRKSRGSIHLMADYTSTVLWNYAGAPLDPARLPLSPRLRARLARWCAQFQKSFETEIDLDAFAAEGRAIGAGYEDGIAGLVDRLFRRSRRGARGLSRIAIGLRGRNLMTGQLPAVAAPTRITARLRAAHPVPALIAAAGERASLRFLEFFAANIRNPHTRRAYGRAVAEFLAWCDERRRAVDRRRAAAARRGLDRAADARAAPRRRVKQRLAAIRHLFDWLVTGQVVPVEPGGLGARPVAHRDSRARRRCSNRPRRARCSTASTSTTPAGLRDRALIGLMVYSASRASARRSAMKVEDVFTQNRRLWVRLREKGGKPHAMPCHHNLEDISHRLSRRRRPCATIPRGRCSARSAAAPAS